MDASPQILNVHTPVSSFAIVQSHDDTLETLFEKLIKKTSVEFNGQPVKSGWVKYSWNGSIWNLDDDSDYTIFVWRQKSTVPGSEHWPVLHVRDPDMLLPEPPAYRNAAFYMFAPQPSASSLPKPRSTKSSAHKSKTKATKPTEDVKSTSYVPKHKIEFEKFQNENGVRTVMGNIGTIKNVRMLLKSGYRHVYISRKFAAQHGFIPADAAPGHYGYSGLVNLGTWPITIGRTKTNHTVFLSEESHFDVILGRSFMEKRGVKFDPVDPTDVVCMDTGEKIDCELVILKDGKGQIVTVT